MAGPIEGAPKYIGVTTPSAAVETTKITKRVVTPQAPRMPEVARNPLKGISLQDFPDVVMMHRDNTPKKIDTLRKQLKREHHNAVKRAEKRKLSVLKREAHDAKVVLSSGSNIEQKAINASKSKKAGVFSRLAVGVSMMFNTAAKPVEEIAKNPPVPISQTVDNVARQVNFAYSAATDKMERIAKEKAKQVAKAIDDNPGVKQVVEKVLDASASVVEAATTYTTNSNGTDIVGNGAGIKSSEVTQFKEQWNTQELPNKRSTDANYSTTVYGGFTLRQRDWDAVQTATGQTFDVHAKSIQDQINTIFTNIGTAVRHKAVFNAVTENTTAQNQFPKHDDQSGTENLDIQVDGNSIMTDTRYYYTDSSSNYKVSPDNYDVSGAIIQQVRLPEYVYQNYSSTQLDPNLRNRLNTSLRIFQAQNRTDLYANDILYVGDNTRTSLGAYNTALLNYRVSENQVHAQENIYANEYYVNALPENIKFSFKDINGNTVTPTTMKIHVSSTNGSNRGEKFIADSSTSLDPTATYIVNTIYSVGAHGIHENDAVAIVETDQGSMILTVADLNMAYFQYKTATTAPKDVQVNMTLIKSTDSVTAAQLDTAMAKTYTQISTNSAPTATPGATATSSSTPTTTSTATATTTFTVTASPSSTFSPTTTSTASSTGTATDTPTATGTPTPTDTPTATSTASHTSTITATSTPTASATSSSTATATMSVTVTDTPTPTGTPTDTPTTTSTATTTFSPTITATPTDTPTMTATATFTMSPTTSATPTITATPINTNSPTSTDTPSATSTASSTSTVTGTAVPTATTGSSVPPPSGGVPGGGGGSGGGFVPPPSGGSGGFTPPTSTPTQTPTATITATAQASPIPTPTSRPVGTPTPTPVPPGIGKKLWLPAVIQVQAPSATPTPPILHPLKNVFHYIEEDEANQE